MADTVSSHSGGRKVLREESLWAVCPQTAAKRERRVSLVPSRQATVWYASAGKLKASALTETGRWPGARRRFLLGRPSPTVGSGGKGAVPGAQTLVAERIPTA